MSKRNDSKLCIYTASAGSGKTYTLSKEYIAMCLEDSLKEILAITFTNASTADMKSKILSTLYQEAFKDTETGDLSLLDYWREDIKKRSGKDLTYKDLQNRLKNLLLNILHSYDSFSIKTIDTFVLNMIKPFAFELNFQRNAEPDIDEGKWKESIKDWIVDNYNKKDKDPILKQLDATIDLLRDFYLENKKTLKNIAISLEEKTNYVLNETIRNSRAISTCENEEDIEERLNLAKEILEKTSRAKKDAVSKIEAIAKFFKGKEVEDLYYGVQSPYRFLLGSITYDILCEFIEKLYDSSRFSPNNNDKYKQNIFKAAKDGKGCDEAVKAIDCELRDFVFYGGLDEIKKITNQIKIRTHQYEDLLWQVLVPMMKFAKKNLQERDSKVPLGEYSQKVQELLKESELPFVYERLGTRFKHILIDEFQDTSKLQWSIIKPLIDNNLAEGKRNMIVGDPKQSIYRFRGADYNQMLDLIKFPSNHTENLPSNYRSKGGIIAFNNLFYEYVAENAGKNGFELPEYWGIDSQGKVKWAEEFSEIKQYFEDRLREIYQNQAQKEKNKGFPKIDSEAVSIFVYKGEEAEEGEDSQDVDEEAASIEAASEGLDGEEKVSTKYKKWTYKLIKAIIDRCRREEEEQHKNFPAEKRDRSIAVLCRKNEDVSEIAEYLSKEKYKVSTDIGMLAILSFEVRLLKNIVFYWADSDSSASRSYVEFLLSRYFDSECNETQEKIQNAIEHINLLRYSSKSIYKKLVDVIEYLNLKTDQRLLSFIDLVYLNKIYTESDFKKFWEEKDWDVKCKVCLPPVDKASDTIVLSTIHKSKGLEYGVVIYPFADKIIKKDEEEYASTKGLDAKKGTKYDIDRDGYIFKNEKWTKENTSDAFVDMLNNTYVATTRPKNKLFVLYQDLPAKDAKESGKLPFTSACIWKSFVETEKGSVFLKDSEKFLAEPRAADLSGESSGLSGDCETEHVGGEVAVCGSETHFEENTNSENSFGSDKKQIESQGCSGFKNRNFYKERYDFEHCSYSKLDANSKEENFGNLMHHLLSFVKILSGDEKKDKNYLKSIVETYKRAYDRQNEYQETELLEMLQAVIYKKDLHPAFFAPLDMDAKPIVLNEQSYVYKGEVQRPDRVVFVGDYTYLLDYKTGKAKAQYKKQVSNYVDFLIASGRDVGKLAAYIVYMDKNDCKLEKIA